MDDHGCWCFCSLLGKCCASRLLHGFGQLRLPNFCLDLSNRKRCLLWNITNFNESYFELRKKNLTLICLFFSNKRHLPLFAHHVISHFIPSAQYSIAAWFTGIYPRSFVQGAKWDRDAPTDGQCIQTTNWDDNLENYYLGIVKSQ